MPNLDDQNGQRQPKNCRQNIFCGDFWLNKSESCQPDSDSAPLDWDSLPLDCDYFPLDCDTKMIRWQI